MKPYLYFILIVLFLTSIGLLIFIGFQIKSEGAKCLGNPIVYSVQKLTESNLADVTCTCTASKPGNPTIIVTKDGITTPRIDNNYIQEDFNISEALKSLK